MHPVRIRLSALYCAIRRPEDSTLCRSLLDWLTHRREVNTWSNLRHWRLHQTKEWSEYEGELVRTAWTPEELRDLKMTRPYLYRIRDEILVAVDVWQVQPRNSTGALPAFEWVPVPQPLVKIEYDMMETYVRKLLVPATGVVEQPTHLMKAVQATGFEPVGELAFNRATHWGHYKAPKQHGIFKLVLKSISSGQHTRVWLETLMPLRTYKHDEDPRFVPAGYPFYSAMLVSTLAFTSVLLLFPLLPPVQQKQKPE
eukprot:Protomagalhaensia_sp_Gyna_25__1215@NODE_1601_length_1699_cov_6_116265_g1307_i0_p2_GENE_NODE_1601_length_1699_cov_6_116265_g1307_i0NODE_1601_length_1699_cov_6_116265_g1307_i0_p2_ORF_typecomplete_len255_score6_93DDOST_48kD/PF03345_14/2_4e22_NODE_1601_length_1699_cov_6_116265_g1307_i08521616